MATPSIAASSDDAMPGRTLPWKEITATILRPSLETVMTGFSINRHLTGESRWRLATPALLLDLDALEHNITALAAHFSRTPAGWRPHAKTHKCAEIARRQLDAGATGICVAKLGEADALVREGIGRILITSPIVTADKLERVLALNDTAEELILVVDNTTVVDRLASLASDRQKPMKVLIDLGIGLNRTGVSSIPDAVTLAREIVRRPSLDLAGLQCYAGDIQHIADCAEREGEAAEVAAYVDEAHRAIAPVAGAPGIVTGGGTGTFDHDSGCGVFTDIQVGSAIFMDVQYNGVMRRDGTPGPFRTALFVQSTVISANVAGAATIDAGIKAFATDGPVPDISDGAPEGSLYEFMGDEHGRIVVSPGANGPAVGDVVTCITPHCDPTVNLHDGYHCVRGDRLVDIWPIEGRGRTW